jgi:tRNA A37 threonylcarbamoyltransferase TsaD
VFHIDNLNIVGRYNINGKVLLLNLQGEGPANLTALGGDYHVKAAISRYEKNGENYLKIHKPTLDFTLKKASFDFGNLLNGDEKLGPEINQILNENWQDVLKDLGAPIQETVTTIIESIVSKILDKVPEKYILPE